ncbi:uncharacterized protein LOC113273670 isoform X2 [Papaver somniferum]|uniref:uncharacterized protein LOC113273670 isoform X2 n=1 Tax=Papaver somniferum TaxID=3469 RepID=UPI000E6FA9C9|nr:uncharacterized protein LOC113273670 isoform X2 [Papaver somniferum]
MNFHIYQIPVSVPSPVPAKESNGPPEECFTRVPSSPLAQERKRRGRPCENSTIKKGGSDNHGASPREVMSFSSPFPFFWTCVKHFNDIRLTIPIKFAREHLPAKVTYPKSGEEKNHCLATK